jgi:hypothetical protein
MRAPQAVLLAIVVGLIAPALISRDLRAKAWLVYFTRPLGRTDYILGKVLTLAAIVGLVTLVPALVLWIVGVLVSPSVWVAVAGRETVGAMVLYHHPRSIRIFSIAVLSDFRGGGDAQKWMALFNQTLFDFVFNFGTLCTMHILGIIF